MSQSSSQKNNFQPRRIQGVNYIGLWTLARRETDRFLIVFMQTIIAPVITTLLFYTIFALAFGGNVRQVGGIPFLEFLAPGLIMMTMVQNAFGNTSSSIMISKFQGNIVDTLMPPLSEIELFMGFIAGGILRGLSVGLATALAISFFVPLAVHSLVVILFFALAGTMMLGSLGIMAAIWAEKFDHIAAVTNFIVTPLTFLSGTFYSIESLPETWRVIALYNPFFYMIDGFRAGFIEQADSHILTGVVVLSATNIAMALIILWMFKSGYKIKS